MICFVDIEHEKIRQDPERRPAHLGYLMDVKLKLEALSGLPCIVRRFPDVTRQWLRRFGITHLVLSGNATDWDDYDEGAWAEMHPIIREAEWPIIGFCGGAQLIAMAHGAPLGPIRRLRPGEPEVTTLSAPGYYKEWCFMPIQVIKSDPLFQGLGRSPVFLQVHYWEIKEPPAGFQVLAASDECPIQVIKHDSRPVYGTQFHPEAYTERPYNRRNRLVKLVYPQGYEREQLDGKTLLTNFFRSTGVKDATE